MTLFGVLITSYFLAFAQGLPELPARYEDLLDYVIQAPDQGETATCMFVSSTGAMEILLNQKHGLRNQVPGDRFDLAERHVIIENPGWSKSRSKWIPWIAEAWLKFNLKRAIHSLQLPFQAWNPDGTVNWTVWNYPADYDQLPKMQVPEVDFEPLFVRGGRYATYVLDQDDVLEVKRALVEHQAPVLINYNDEGWWHMILIVGYNDDIPGECYFTPQEECSGRGAFWVRDSAGTRVEARDYDWFRVNGNAAMVTKLWEPNPAIQNHYRTPISQN